MNDAYPVRFAVDYPDRDLNRLTSARSALPSNASSDLRAREGVSATPP